MGADLAYIGSPFVATEEANAQAEYKQAIVEGRASDIVYSSYFTGVHGNYLRQSIVASGMDPDKLPEGDLKTMNFAGGEGAKKAWRDIWGSGQGIGAVDKVQGAGEYVAQLAREYEEAKAALCLPSESRGGGPPEAVEG
jgi:nitronate monooxygenase